jgi:hypothetical protein
MKYEAITLCDRHTKAVDFLNPLPSPRKMLTVLAGAGRGEKEKSISLPSGPYAHDASTSRRRALRTPCEDFGSLDQASPGALKASV